MTPPTCPRCRIPMPSVHEFGWQCATCLISISTGFDPDGPEGRVIRREALVEAVVEAARKWMAHGGRIVSSGLDSSERDLVGAISAVDALEES